MTTRPSPRTPDRRPDHSATGRISLLGLEGYGHHGDLPAERELGAQFTLDLELTTDTRRVAQTDTLTGAVDYVKVEALARRILEGKPFRLLESLAEHLATAILDQPGVLRVTVRVTKRPPLPHLRAFTVEITRPLPDA
ncbi:MAG TPA: dihydroneopterin aldolase [Candidatus Limnocylindrales bacterium]|nr:dihydroneopterin aldolase [Candidatus Limnocylindrales bacterium]